MAIDITLISLRSNGSVVTMGSFSFEFLFVSVLAIAGGIYVAKGMFFKYLVCFIDYIFGIGTPET